MINSTPIDYIQKVSQFNEENESYLTNQPLSSKKSYQIILLVGVEGKGAVVVRRR